MVPEGHFHIGIDGNKVEQNAHGGAAQKGGSHDFPAADAGDDQKKGADQDGQGRSLPDGTGNKSQKCIHHVELHITGGCLSQNGSPRKGIDDFVSLPKGNPHLVARHLRRIGKEEKSTGYQRGIPDIHAGAPENLLAEDHGKGRRYRHHPQRGVNGHYHRDQHPGNQKTFVDLMTPRLGKNEFYTQSRDIRNNDHRKDFQETVKENPQEPGIAQLPDCLEMLESRIVHPEEERRNQRNDHKRHRPLQIDMVMDMCS